jgi:hypothetical protein
MHTALLKVAIYAVKAWKARVAAKRIAATARR